MFPVFQARETIKPRKTATNNACEPIFLTKMFPSLPTLGNMENHGQLFATLPKTLERT